MVQTSFTIREFVRERLLDPAEGFNFFITQAAPSYGVQPFQLSIQSSPPTLWLGRYDLSTLVRQVSAAQLPCAILSVAKDDSRGKLALRATPSTFAGTVLVSVDFHIGYPEGAPPPDGEAMFHAVEDAMVNTFNTPTSYGFIPGGVGYNNELIVSQGNMELTNSNGWVQQISFGMDFFLIA